MITTHGLKVQEWNRREAEARKRWQMYCRSGLTPADIPDRPDLAYPEEWRGWQHWLGEENETLIRKPVDK